MKLINPNWDQHGYIQVYTGDGKGKTSSANGALIRAAGSGMKCALVQFFKNGAGKR